jgi:flagellar assembly factor FliW
MKLGTTRFGEMDLPEETIIHIPEGILGFPNDRHYVVLEHDAEGTPFKWLQSCDSDSLAFIVIDPRLIAQPYRLEFDEETVNFFGSIVPEEFVPMVIVNVPKNQPIEMTANMKAPILVHISRRMGRQIVLSADEYSITHRIFPDGALEEPIAAQSAR